MKLHTAIPAYTRAEAYTLLKSALKIAQDSKRREEYFRVTQIESLLKYFLPASPAVPKTPEQWCAKAVAGKNDVRYYLRYLYSDGSRLVGTDGHRMHLTSTDWAEGFYCPKTGARVDIDAKYPDIGHVLNFERPNLQTVVMADLETKLLPPPTIGGKKAVVAIKIAEGLWVQEQYLKQAVCNEDAATLRCGDTVHGESKFGEFIIMPVKVD